MRIQFVALTVNSPAGTTASLSSPTLSIAAPVSVLINAGTTQPGGTFDVGFSAPGLPTQTLRAIVGGSTAIRPSLISFVSSTPSLVNDGISKSFSLPFSYGYADKLYASCFIPSRSTGIAISRGIPTGTCSPDKDTACTVPFVASVDPSIPVRIPGQGERDSGMKVNTDSGLKPNTFWSAPEWRSPSSRNQIWGERTLDNSTGR